MKITKPVSARTDTFVSPVKRRAFSLVRFLFVRHGSAIISGPHGRQIVTAGDVLVLAPDTLLGGRPEGAVTITTVFADLDYLLDQAYWQYSGLVADVFHVAEILTSRFTDAMRVLTPGEARMGLLSPWLDGLVEWTIDGPPVRGFFRMQAHLASILDVIAPFFSLDQAEFETVTRPVPLAPARQQYRPTRSEARQMRELLEMSMFEQWPLARLAASVHLSPAQAHRVFLDAYGMTPLAWQSRLRVKEMAKLLRTTDQAIADIVSQVGWRDRGHAALMFRRATGVTPRAYRRQFDTSDL